ncbi:uncharacterized protein CIMG_03038 [Coccidioides immitis RS]|uniref:Uncharacterized protein n=4 Tax=Coccidioides immitis TaxID=5501 RepID=J3KAG7_COCIM|nr:uncharacterized protein CIMG_03038 [Coccidioides immitis RS]KMP07201.1 hypothetical protein CIRG_06882 [Coccidioides immitis RMSCC 2394]KMU78064.1 hypothetical protein CISG_06826 [Coccidioides immitis RMSCC 3703]KMU82273.1 hypothetical protein CIHG_00059 [Coccidioides immitis H538.4]TPX19204.1 hypothetical protein DIZ76_016990 [Coccidioides immitis]EAS32014.3 hypothetical protein CIMG_03038 [Coccidioides immitis RS]
MPPLSKRKALPFKPPRSIAATTENASTSASKHESVSGSGKPRKRTKTQAVAVTRSPSPPLVSEPSQSPANRLRSPEHGDYPTRSIDSLSSEPEYILAEITAPKEEKRQSLETSEPDFPPKLLAAIIHHHMKSKGEKMRIKKDANRLYAKYIDIFVKEAVARAIHERREKLNTDGIERDRSRRILDSYLEVEDLEKLAPQLLLDF